MMMVIQLFKRKSISSAAIMTKVANKYMAKTRTTMTMTGMITLAGIISFIISHTISSLTMIIIIGNLFTSSLYSLRPFVICDIIHDDNNNHANSDQYQYQRLIINQPNSNESLLASEHYNRVLKYAKCQYPMAKVVNIQNELQNPSATKKYIPHCTILHYCGEHTGCCRLETEHCIAKTIEMVRLYFWTIEITARGHKKGIEVIMMKNHTECMCAPINQKSSSSPSSSSSSSLSINHHGTNRSSSSSSYHSNHHQHRFNPTTLRFEPVTTSLLLSSYPTTLLPTTITATTTTTMKKQRKKPIVDRSKSIRTNNST